VTLSSTWRPIGLTVAAVLVAIGTVRTPAWPDETPAQPTTRKAAFLAENEAAMDKMMKDMAIKPSGDVDRDFVAMMVPHHQGAIDMAEALLRYGHNERLRRLAQEIIVTQQQEIAAMRLAVGESLPPSTPAPDQPSSATTPMPSHVMHMHQEP
jgi:hypothetical protein